VVSRQPLQQALPLPTWAHQCQLPRYWWLRMLQQSPPNPTRVESPQNTKTMWWYDMIREMQEADAKAAQGERPR
jgi:hypothetical protein